MPNSYVLLEKITVGAAGASSVTFSGIPQTGYTDLVVKASIRSALAGPGDDIVWQFNGDTSTSNYSYRRIVGDGSGVSSSANSSYGFDSAGLSPAATATANTFGNLEIYIPNYTSSNYKSSSVDAVSENNATAAYTTLAANLWSNTAAITSIKIYSANLANLTQYSTFYLYGVAKLGTTPAIAPKAAGGDIVDTDGTYWYHTFLSSGTFTPAVGLSCDYLVVAGGGAGGGNSSANTAGGAGGGAGGYRTSIGGSPVSLTTTSYTVTIGAGGAGAAGAGSSGSNSVFDTFTSTGGGAAGSWNSPAGVTGGSGGGGAGRATVETNLGGSGTSGQGNAGGTGNSSSTAGVTLGGGGGGGASAVGATANSTGNGNGGAGTALSITGTSVTYAGGGGGGASFPVGGGNVAGTGGSGGGGAGYRTTSLGNFGNGTAGTANTGGGGGGGSNDYAGSGNFSGGSGGSGIVVVRYLVA